MWYCRKSFFGSSQDVAGVLNAGNPSLLLHLIPWHIKLYAWIPIIDSEQLAIFVMENLLSKMYSMHNYV